MLQNNVDITKVQHMKNFTIILGETIIFQMYTYLIVSIISKIIMTKK